MAVTSVSSPLPGEAERAELTGILPEVRSVPVETGTGRRATALAVRDGARNAR